jgi:hypothetical protein
MLVSVSATAADNYDKTKMCNQVLLTDQHDNKAGYVTINNRTSFTITLKKEYGNQSTPPSMISPGESGKYEALNGNRYQISNAVAYYQINNVNYIPDNNLDFSIVLNRNSRARTPSGPDTEPQFLVFPGLVKINSDIKFKFFTVREYGSASVDINDDFINAGIYIVGGWNYSESGMGDGPDKSNHDDSFYITVAELPVPCNKITSETFIYKPTGNISDGTGGEGTYSISSCDVFTNTVQKAGNSPYYCFYETK